MPPQHYQRVELPITITLRTALHIGTGFGLAQLLDDVTVQGAHPHYSGVDLPYIPGSSMKGRLRANLRSLGAALWELPDHTYRASEARLFGFPDTPGSLVFRNAYLQRPAQLLGNQGSQARLPYMIRSERSFVSLSRQRRVALDKRLFRIELTDHDLTFETRIQGTLPSAHARRDLALLLVALRDLTHLGGHKGRGLGRCQVTLDVVKLDETAHPWQSLVEELR